MTPGNLNEEVEALRQELLNEPERHNKALDILKLFELMLSKTEEMMKELGEEVEKIRKTL